MKKFILIFSVLLIAGYAFHAYKFSVIPAWKVPKLLSSMRAKEFCTCYFLQQKGEDYCLKSVLKGYPKFEFILNKNQKSVTFKNPISSSSATVISPKLGCHLK